MRIAAARLGESDGMNTKQMRGRALIERTRTTVQRQKAIIRRYDVDLQFSPAEFVSSQKRRRALRRRSQFKGETFMKGMKTTKQSWRAGIIFV
jgi:hypothetical protein